MSALACSWAVKLGTILGIAICCDDLPESAEAAIRIDVEPTARTDDISHGYPSSIDR